MLELDDLGQVVAGERRPLETGIERAGLAGNLHGGRRAAVDGRVQRPVLEPRQKAGLAFGGEEQRHAPRPDAAASRLELVEESLELVVALREVEGLRVRARGSSRQISTTRVGGRGADLLDVLRDLLGEGLGQLVLHLALGFRAISSRSAMIGSTPLRRSQMSLAISTRPMPPATTETRRASTLPTMRWPTRCAMLASWRRTISIAAPAMPPLDSLQHRAGGDLGRRPCSGRARHRPGPRSTALRDG